MKAPKELAEKIRTYEKTMQEAKSLFKEITDWFNDNGADVACIENIFTSNEAEEKYQGDGEYCSQSSVGDSGDSFHGVYYRRKKLCRLFILVLN